MLRECNYVLHYDFGLTFVVQVIGNLLIIVIQKANANSQGDFWSKLERLRWVLHAIHPPLKLKA